MVNGLKCLPAIFGTVFLPETVKNEVLPGKSALGDRDHTKQLILDIELEDAYSKSCNFFEDLLENPALCDS